MEVGLVHDTFTELLGDALHILYVKIVHKQMQEKKISHFF